MVKRFFILRKDPQRTDISSMFGTGKIQIKCVINKKKWKILIDIEKHQRIDIQIFLLYLQSQALLKSYT